MEATQIEILLIERLKQDVQRHPILQHNWLQEKSKDMSLQDLHLWLSQEYFVSVDFVNWFLKVAVQTNSIPAKIVLVENIWEELGEGVETASHVKILEKFLKETQFNFENLVLLPSTKKYLNRMQEIIESDFYKGLGALGPANEYLLKLEYSKIFTSYQNLQKKISLPRAHFFEINLEADESHSAKMFALIQATADSQEKMQKVIDGNLQALDARLYFYDGL